MAILGDELKLRTEYCTVRNFIGKYKRRIGVDVAQTANQIEAILNIQGKNLIGQRSVAIIVVRLTFLLRMLNEDVFSCDSVEYSQERAQVIDLINLMLAELKAVDAALQLEARQCGDLALLGDPIVTDRVVAYIRQR